MSINGYSFSEDWLNVLVAIHVISAIVGIGPAFFSHVLLRKGQTLNQLRNSLQLVKKLELFPKILGSLAVVSGLLLAWLGDYGFDQLWIYGSIALYVIIQIVVIGFMAPAGARAAAQAFASTDDSEKPANDVLSAAVSKVNAINYIATTLGIILFLFMFFKPTL
ncbi:DUF2269 family protein [Cohnella yongneupensis]|uniref:DUF2269 family protein n=1 Tax=Cohnella yongneupensis TaxID=425006 RepID=A0ABW0R684_9BACL